MVSVTVTFDRQISPVCCYRVLAEKLVELGSLQSVSYMKSIPTHEKLFAEGKSGPNATFNLVFLGLGWPWVGEFDGFIIMFPTEFGKSQTFFFFFLNPPADG